MQTPETRPHKQHFIKAYRAQHAYESHVYEMEPEDAERFIREYKITKESD